MLSKARRKEEAEAVSFVIHNLHEPLPFKQGEFDLVVSGLVLEHIGDLASFFSEVERVLVNSGRAVISAMHPAMFLRDSQAQFTDPCSGEKIRPGSLPHQLSEIVMSAVSTSLELVHFSEYSADAQLAAKFARSEKYVGWPMLALFQFRIQHR